MTNEKRKCQLKVLGLVSYPIAWELQRSLVDVRKHNPTEPDILLLLEHPPVYTLGQGADKKFLKFDPNNSDETVVQIERGGEVTYHSPGQLVGYPILNLHYYRQDLHWYLRQLEEVIIQTIAAFGLQGDRVAGMTGVWIGDAKVAAIGIKVSRWITMHGFALNVCPDLSGFQKIVPCGIADKSVTSLAQFVPKITVEAVREPLIQSFADVFQVEFERLNTVIRSVDEK